MGSVVLRARRCGRKKRRRRWLKRFVRTCYLALDLERCSSGKVIDDFAALLICLCLTGR